MNLGQEEQNNFLTSIEMVARLLTKGRQKGNIEMGEN